MTAVALTHVAFEDAGLVADALADRGMTLETYPAWQVPMCAEEAPLVILLGGPISANDDDLYPFLSDEIDLVRRRLAAGRPVLGICLGAQIMARAIGGSVRPGPAAEIGWAPVELTEAGAKSPLAGLRDVSVLHWHGELCELPDGVDSLASTEHCATQAFAPAANALGLQFHLEAGANGIEPWLVGHSCELNATPGMDVRRLRQETNRLGPLLRDPALNVLGRWLEDAGIGR